MSAVQHQLESRVAKVLGEETKKTRKCLKLYYIYCMYLLVPELSTKYQTSTLKALEKEVSGPRKWTNSID